MRKDDRSLGAPLIPGKAKTHAVCCLEIRNLWCAHTQRPLLPRRGVHVEHAGADESVRVSVKQWTEEEACKTSLVLKALGKAAGVDYLHGGELAREVLRCNPENAFAEDRAGRA